ncbi:BRO family protein [Anaeromusa sp.]|uniref:BRO-N domain-containing protein n=1 Tax=Anaeromusa sp. TaxID=1872520 RepID=UPI00261F4D65|nr:BRO family protein [Anaeromusa sp.]MDD3158845.1 BRO family protein [Anaeromusa sp.]
MKQLQKVFNYQGQQVRTVNVNGEPWFVAKDVCGVLEMADVSMTLQRLDNDEKATSSICTPGGCQETSIINEPGLYSLILGSRKPEAKPFKRWVTHEVLPNLRKSGSYTMDEDPVSTVDQVIIELSKRLTLSEIVTLFETRLAMEDNQYNGEAIEVFIQRKKTGKRSHCKVESNKFADEVKSMIDDGFTYQEIANVFQERGVDISRSSVGRYGQRYLKEKNRQEPFAPNSLKLISLVRSLEGEMAEMRSLIEKQPVKIGELILKSAKRTLDE